METIDTILAYKDSYKIIQDRDEFSFSIDSTILSFFLDIRQREGRIIDLGTGNAIIPLIASMRCDKEIYGLEIQDKSYDRAKRSVELNRLEDRIKIIHGDIRRVKEIFPPSSFTLVSSNPPYFRLTDTKDKNDNESLTIARHEVLVTMEDVIKSASYLLKDKGEFCMVQRTERFLETLELLGKYSLSAKRIRFVYPKKGKESYVFMIDARKNVSTQGLKVLEPLYIYGDDGDYSNEVREYFHYGEER